MKKIVTELESMDFYYLGISSVAKDILLITKINAELDYQFFYSNNLKIQISKEELEEFNVFKNAEFEETEAKIAIIEVKNQNVILFPKLKQMDYLIVANFPIQQLKATLSKLQVVNIVFDIDLKFIKERTKDIEKLFWV
jgi:hypothetical protein